MVGLFVVSWWLVGYGDLCSVLLLFDVALLAVSIDIVGGLVGEWLVVQQLVDELRVDDWLESDELCFVFAYSTILADQPSQPSNHCGCWLGGWLIGCWLMVDCQHVDWGLSVNQLTNQPTTN